MAHAVPNLGKTCLRIYEFSLYIDQTMLDKKAKMTMKYGLVIKNLLRKYWSVIQRLLYIPLMQELIERSQNDFTEKRLLFDKSYI